MLGNWKVIGILTLVVWTGMSGPAAHGEGEIDKALLDAFRPHIKAGEVIAGEKNPVTAEKIDLGRMLFYEPRLSKNQKISCNSCHQLDNYGVDSEATSPGHKGQRGGRNSPTVYHAAGHLAQFWDGREPDVEAQAKGPVLNPIEMAMPSEQHVVKVLKSIPGYVKAFKQAFPDQKDPLTYDNMAKAIGAFERKLVTPSRVDKYLAGDTKALTLGEKQGMIEFFNAGCLVCHTGRYFGGDKYMKLGLVKPWPGIKDVGRSEITKNESDKHAFKVPSLRNIAKTGPYLHDGSQTDLKKQIRMMAKHQLGKDLTDKQVESIHTFLQALTGEIPKDYIKKPKLPKSGPNTPGPDNS